MSSYVEYGYQAEDQDQVARRDLMRTCSFTEADLVENRQGRMSSAQLVRVSAKAVWPILALGVPLVGLVLMAVFAGTVFPYIITKVRLMMTMGKYVVAFGGALVFGLIALVINFVLHSERLLLYLADLASGKVLSDSGRLHATKGEEIQDGIDQILRRKTLTYNFVVKGQTYQVSEAAYDALLDQAGSVFRVYFTPKSRFLLSIEPFRQE
ncbi:MAG: hypothetical protein K2X03_16700 [Bryobacteraceae bacterium]|nr:hypothetical protein [Bryobacteraceae bacterium]